MRMTPWFASIKDFYKWIIFRYIHWVVESVSQHICCRGLLSMNAPLPEETRGFSFVVRILPEKQHPNHFSICSKGCRDNQLILNRLGSEWGWNRQLHTHLPQKWWCREPAGGFFFLPSPPSVKINKITIKKFLVVTKAGFLIDSSERHKRRGEASCIKSENWFSIG